MMGRLFSSPLPGRGFFYTINRWFAPPANFRASHPKARSGVFSHSEPDLDSSRFLGLLDDDIGKTGIGADRWRVKQKATVDAVRIVPENLAACCVRSVCRSPSRDADQL